MDFKVSDELLNMIIVEWITFKETHEDAWAEKRDNKFVMGTAKDGILKEINLTNRNI